MGKSFTNVWTYVVIVFIFSIFMIIIGNYGGFLESQDEKGIIDLPVLDDYRQYQLNLNATKTQIEDPVSYKYNTTEGTPKDFAIPFLFSQEKSDGIRGKIQYLYSIPSSLLSILGLPVSNFESTINALFWLLVAGILIAMIYLIRAVPT